MARTVSLAELEKFIDNNIRKIAAAERELDELQTGFNSQFTEFKAEHDATLAQLTNAIVGRLDAVGPDLRRDIDSYYADERERLTARRRELETELVPQAQREMDDSLAQSQKDVERIRTLNPELDSREERHKANLVSLKGRLDELNANIKQLAKGLGFITNMGKIRQLDKQRQQLIGQVKSTQAELRVVREEWQKAQEKFQAQQGFLQVQWQAKNLALARLREELEYLRDERKREALALRRAVNWVLDNWKTATTCPDKALEQEVNHMVELNVMTDTYEEALGRVAGLIALLRGISKGMESFRASVQGLIGEEKMHSAYLSKLKLAIPATAVTFYSQWDGLKKRVVDDKEICAHPQEFIDLIMPVFEQQLSEATIERVFNGMGDALTAATRTWKG